MSAMVRSIDIRRTVISAPFPVRNRLARRKIPPVYVVHETVAVIIDSFLPVQLGFVNPDIILQIRMIYVDASVHYRYYYLFIAFFDIPPYRNDIHIASLNRMRDAAVIIIMPLVSKPRVVEHFRSSSRPSVIIFIGIRDLRSRIRRNGNRVHFIFPYKFDDRYAIRTFKQSL